VPVGVPAMITPTANNKQTALIPRQQNAVESARCQNQQAPTIDGSVENVCSGRRDGDHFPIRPLRLSGAGTSR
jgi:hypothetical protein